MKNASKYFKFAADNGIPDAQCQYGQLLEKNKNAGKDRFSEAARYYKMAADNGNALAQANYGNLLEKGKGTPRDVRGAIRMYRISAEHGNSQGQCFLARMYENGYGMKEKDENEAIKYYKLSIAQGNTTAMSSLALLYEKQGNFQEALPMMRKAADMNQQYAMLQYARMIEKVNPKDAYTYVKKCADMNNIDALARVGYMIHNGIGVQRNDAEALNVLRQAALKGSADAMFHYATMCKHGQGGPQNMQEALKYLELAAKNGCVEAKNIWDKMPKKETPPENAGRGGRGGRGGNRCGRGGRGGHTDMDDESPRGNNRGGRGGRGGNRGGRGGYSNEADNDDDYRQENAGGRGGRGRGRGRGGRGGYNNEPEDSNFNNNRGRGGRGGNNNRGGKTYNVAQEQPANPLLTTSTSTPGAAAQAPEQPKPVEQQKPTEPKQPKPQKVKEDKPFVEAKETQKKNGGPEKQFKLAMHFFEDESREDHLVLAYHFMKLAAERLPEAMMTISKLLIEGKIGEKYPNPNVEAALHYLTLATRLPYIPAMHRLMEMYLNGEGVPKDEKKYAFYMKMAADSGDKDLAMKYSLMARKGEIIKLDNKVADEYLKKAADLKLLEAQLIVANKLREIGNNKAALYYEGAAENGDFESMKLAGQFYNTGELAPAEDVRKAKKFLSMAAKRGGDEEKATYEEFMKTYPERLEAKIKEEEEKRQREEEEKRLAELEEKLRKKKEEEEQLKIEEIEREKQLKIQEEQTKRLKEEEAEREAAERAAENNNNNSKEQAKNKEQNKNA
ncbi:hypothetical protein TRFO_10637 [Tritrichomonas foetus]|uniref:Uncharacterized protein n=1 Tax=Tritrichomonas foetus TaxID=1144522 RepID=A0A1J4JCL6_9EUKA|nr:hypothetical protein TRFO_10637 [Tritrichomonas foetus]|eukprot:OHS95157.1 hypothetical protein TRFO_10637 [Tritrichomonas foetus]